MKLLFNQDLKLGFKIHGNIYSLLKKAFWQQKYAGFVPKDFITDITKARPQVYIFQR